MIAKSSGVLAMLLRSALSAIALALTAMAAGAADLPGQSRLGVIFAEPYQDRPAAYRPSETYVTNVPWVTNSPRVPGYYGRAGDFYYTNYYGTPSNVIFGRLPYACNFYGLC
jgi:hypothetical protein